MKKLTVSYLNNVNHWSSSDELLSAIAGLPNNEVAEVPWPDKFPYKPEVGFKLAYTQDCLLLGFQVKEKHVKAIYRNTNDPVYKDSCVEFFLSFDTTHYYNFEFNCMGIGLIGYGSAEKSTRKRLQKEQVELVKTVSSIPANKEVSADDTRWELLLNIPFEVFKADAITSFSGKRCTANFYKCGDDLPIPHYLAWNPIEYPTPNFHLPQFFGELFFNNIGN